MKGAAPGGRGQLALEGGQHRLEAQDDVRHRVHHRPGEVGLVDVDRPPGVERLHAVVEAQPGGADVGRAVGGVALEAACPLGDLASGLGEAVAGLVARAERAARVVGARDPPLLAGEPAVVVGGRQRHHPGAHHRVAGAAVLGAEDLVAPGGHGLEPGLGVAAGQHVLLHAEVGDEEGVDHVPRGHEEPHRTPRGDAQHVDGVRAFGIRELPHPLFRADVHVHGVGGRSVEPHVTPKAQHEPGEEERQRSANGDDLEEQGRSHPHAALVLLGAPVAHVEVEGHQAHRDRDDAGGGDDEVVELVHLERDARGLWGQEQHAVEKGVVVHHSSRRRSCHQKRPRTIESSVKTSRPPVRKKP